MVPHELGGEGASISDVVDVCYRLGRACASTAMIYAMHQTKVACIVRHGREQRLAQRLLRRLCAEQLLLASSTTEGQGGGDVRKSAAPIEQQGARIALERDATVISYGAQADGVVTTARRSPDAAASDQVLVAFLKEDYSLERMLEWDTLGMRGTCSAGFKLKATRRADQILPEPYETHPRADHDAGRASDLERRLDRHRRRRGRTRAAVRAQRRAQRARRSCRRAPRISRARARRCGTLRAWWRRRCDGSRQRRTTSARSNRSISRPR